MTKPKKKLMVLIKQRIQEIRSIAFARGKEYTLKKYLYGNTRYNQCIKEEDNLEEEILTIFENSVSGTK